MFESVAKRATYAFESAPTECRRNASRSPSIPPSSTPSASAVSNPDLWWSYNYNLDADLVVITPALDIETGIHIAGELPLAKHPKFPSSESNFIQNLISEFKEWNESIS